MSVFRITVLSLFTALFNITPAVAQPVARGGSQLLSEGILNRNGLTRAWWSHATINSKRDRLMHLIVDETHLFLQSSSGAISAFDTDTGKYLWTKQIGVSDRAIYPASSNDELLFVINGLQLFAVNKNTGYTVWQLGMPGMAGTSPAADANRVYVGFVDGSLYAFDLKKTRELFAAGKLPQYSDSCVLWRYRTGKAISAAAIPGEPGPNENVVAFASGNGSLYSVTKEDRKLVFQFETDAPLTAPIVRYKNTLLLASQDFNFYSINIRTGKPGWQFTSGVIIRKAPILIDDEVYLFPDHGNMYKLSAETGKVEWALPRMADFLAASKSRVYVVDRHNNLTILSRDYGKPLGYFPLDQYTRHVANESSDRIYLATESGLVMCLHEQANEFATYHMHPDRQPILPEFAPDDRSEIGAADEATDNEAEGEMPAATDEKPDGEMPADDADSPEQEKPEADKPDEEMPADEKPEADKPDDETEPAAGETSAEEETPADESAKDEEKSE